MHFSNILWATLIALPLTYAQQAADGLIVPFTSVLPVCASKCGPLFDVQGKCTPPNIPTTDSSCFCSDSRLQAFNTAGTAGVSSVCGAASCTAAADLQSIQTWYESYCQNKAVSSTTSSATPGSTTTKSATTSKAASGGTSSGSSGGNQSWLATHTRWVIMIVVVVVGIIVLWIGACLLRRRYLRKKEKEIEMRPPVAWGPHQAQAASGGYTYGDGVVGAAGGRHPGAGGHHKEAAVATPGNNAKVTKEKKQRWFTPSSR